MTRASTVAFVPRNRLSTILSGTDPRSFADHVASAEKAVEAIAPDMIRSIGGDVEVLIRLCRQEEDAVFSRCREIGWLALGIVEVARLARRPALADTAKGIWETVEALSGRGVWHTDALRTHAEALGTLASVDEDGPMGAAIANELARMREAIGAAAAA